MYLKAKVRSHWKERNIHEIRNGFGNELPTHQSVFRMGKCVRNKVGPLLVKYDNPGKCGSVLAKAFKSAEECLWSGVQSRWQSAKKRKIKEKKLTKRTARTEIKKREEELITKQKHLVKFYHEKPNSKSTIWCLQKKKKGLKLLSNC